MAVNIGLHTVFLQVFRVFRDSYLSDGSTGVLDEKIKNERKIGIRWMAELIEFIRLLFD